MIVRLIEAIFLVGLVVGTPTAGVLYVMRSKRAIAPDNCKHRRWTPWKTIKEVPVYLYSELDEGKGLPDRVDAQMERDCISCGLHQVKTVRGIDSQHYK